MYATGFQRSPSACRSTPPIPFFDASVDTLILFVGSKNVSTGAVVSVLLSSFQMIAIIVLLLNWESLEILGYVLMIAAVILTLWSMMIYMKAAWPSLKQG